MVKSIIKLFLLLLVSVFIQSTWFDKISIFTIHPDLSLIILIWIAYEYGPVVGSICGLLLGFTEDYLSTSPMGFYAFIKVATASLVGLLHGKVYFDRFFFPFLAGVSATVLKVLLATLLFLVFASKIQYFNLFESKLWIEVAYNGVIAPLVFFILTTATRFFRRRGENINL